MKDPFVEIQEQIFEGLKAISEKGSKSTLCFAMCNGEYFWSDAQSLLTAVNDLDICLNMYVAKHIDGTPVLVLDFCPNKEDFETDMKSDQEDA